MSAIYRAFPLVALLLSGCASEEYVSDFDTLVEIERANWGNPSVMADQLILKHQLICGSLSENTTAYTDHYCASFESSIGMALYEAHRYRELNDFSINTVYAGHNTLERYNYKMTRYNSSPFDIAKQHQTLSVLYVSLKKSGDQRAKDWIVRAYLLQNNIDPQFTLSDQEFLSDAKQLLNAADYNEAEFYVTNIKKPMYEASVSNQKRNNGDDNQLLADYVAVEKNAYEYAKKNNMSTLYLDYLAMQHKFGLRVMQGN